MITTEGEIFIKRFFAGNVPQLARTIAFGIGSRAESADDTNMQFEVGRSTVSVYPDFVNNKVIFKAALPSDQAVTIKEVGLYSDLTDAGANGIGSRMLLLFDEVGETWNTATWITGQSLIGTDSLRQQPAASATVTSEFVDVTLDLSEYSPKDHFVLAYNNFSGNLSQVRLRFKTDSANYYQVLFPVAAGYNYAEFVKGSAVATGSPSWSEINSVEVASVATSGGAADVRFDALRINLADATDDNSVLVAREAIGSFTVEAGKSNDIEFALNLDFL